MVLVDCVILYLPGKSVDISQTFSITDAGDGPPALDQIVQSV